MSASLGVDIGGTFTDVVFIKDGQLYRGKSDTTHYDLKVGFMNASRIAIERADLQFDQVLKDADSIVYSTTVGTNALIERRGTKLGLIRIRAHSTGWPGAKLGGRLTYRAEIRSRTGNAPGTDHPAERHYRDTGTNR